MNVFRRWSALQHHCNVYCQRPRRWRRPERYNFIPGPRPAPICGFIYYRRDGSRCEQLRGPRGITAFVSLGFISPGHACGGRAGGRRGRRLQHRQPRVMGWQSKAQAGPLRQPCLAPQRAQSPCRRPYPSSPPLRMQLPGRKPAKSRQLDSASWHFVASAGHFLVALRRADAKQASSEPC